MKRLPFYIFFIFLISKADAQVLLENQNAYSVNGNVFIFEETSNALSIQEAWNYYNQNKFTPFATPTNSVNKGFVRSIYWLAIPVENTLSNNQNLEAGISNGGIFRLEFYFVSDSGHLISHYITGTNYDFDSRPIANRHFYFPINLTPLSNTVIFYRIDMRGNGFDIPLEIVGKNYIEQKERSANLFYAFFSGWMVFVVFLSLVTFLWLKDKVYIFYCLYVASGCLFFIGDGNFDFELLYPHWPALATISPTIYGLSLCFFMLLFMRDFLQLKTSHANLFALSRTWALSLILAIILLPCAYVFSTNISLRIFVFGYCIVSVFGAWGLQIYCIVQRILDKYKPAFLYGAAIIFVFLGAAIYLLHVLNIVPDLVPAFIYVSLGFTIEIIILSFALIYSFSFHKAKHHQLSVTLAQKQLNFSRQLIELQEQEQKRIAEDLHDELGGNLAAIKMNLQSLQLPDEGLSINIIKLIDNASDNARHIAHNLMPPEFAKTKLCDLLQAFFNYLRNENAIHFHFHSSGENNHFNKGDDLMIYRIIMELTNNILKHSGATDATVQLIYYDTYLEIMAEDNGKGFSNDLSTGMGITNIESRVNYLQGKMTIDTSVHGTTIMIKVPYNK